MSELITTIRLNADHGQFYAFDAAADPYQPLPEISDLTVRQGWTRNQQAIYYFTVGEFWDFRLDLWRAAVRPPLENAERLLAHSISLPTGQLRVGNPIGGSLASLSITPGDYSLYLRAFNLGQEAANDLADDEFFGRLDLERYELFVVPGPSPSEGLVAGRATLW